MARLHVSPLSSSFMLTSMVGFLISVFFVIMFISSLISMTYAPVDFDERKGRKK